MLLFLGSLDNTTTTLLFLGLGAIVLFFFFIRPQQKEQEKMDLLLKHLKVGDQVITIGGIHATIIDVQEDKFILLSQGETQFALDKQALSLEATQKYYPKELPKPEKKEEKKAPSKPQTKK